MFLVLSCYHNRLPISRLLLLDCEALRFLTFWFALSSVMITLYPFWYKIKKIAKTIPYRMWMQVKNNLWIIQIILQLFFMRLIIIYYTAIRVTFSVLTDVLATMLSELFNILTAISPTISVSTGVISTVANIVYIQCLPPFFNESFYHFKYSHLISTTVKNVLYLIFQT